MRCASERIEFAGAMANEDPMGDDPADLKIILLGDSAVGAHMPSATAKETRVQPRLSKFIESFIP